MNDIRKLREQIDACRPGSDDLALPELAELAAAVKRDRAVAMELERSQRFDGAVAAAMHDLPVPADLQKRLLAALEADFEANQPSPPVVAAPTPQWWQRRTVLAALGSLAAILLFAVAIWQFSRPTRLVSRDELSLAVAEWASDGQLPANVWISDRSKLGAFAPPRGITRTVDRWRRLPASRQAALKAGVAIHLAPPGKPRAMLFVFSSSANVALPVVPVAIPAPTGFPGGKAVAWQNSNTKLIYVLFVEEEGGQRLEHFLPPQRIL